MNSSRLRSVERDIFDLALDNIVDQGQEDAANRDVGVAGMYVRAVEVPWHGEVDREVADRAIEFLLEQSQQTRFLVALLKFGWKMKQSKLLRFSLKSLSKERDEMNQTGQRFGAQLG